MYIPGKLISLHPFPQELWGSSHPKSIVTGSFNSIESSGFLKNSNLMSLGKNPIYGFSPGKKIENSKIF